MTNLEEQDIKNFKKLYEKQFGVEISYEQAKELAQKLIKITRETLPLNQSENADDKC